MKNRILILAIFMIAPLVAPAALHCQEEMRFVDNSIFNAPARPPARFEHDAHNEKAGLEDCNICHHVIEDGEIIEDESSEDQGCSDCHMPEPGARIQPLMKKFHKACKGCHMERKAGPIMCGQCHER